MSMINASNISTNHTFEVPHWIPYKTHLTVWFCINSYIMMAGCILNFLLFIAILSKKSLRNGAGLLIANVVFAEWWICTVFYSLNLFLSSGHPYNDILCKINPNALNLLGCAKYYSLLFLALNRYAALGSPQVYRAQFNFRTNLTLVIISWCVAVGSCVPFGLGFGGYYSHGPRWGSCVFHGDGTSHFKNAIYVHSYFPSAASTAVYGVLAVRETIRNCTRNRSVRMSATFIRRLRWTRILMMLTAFDVVCFLPPILFLDNRAWVLAWPPLALWGRTIRLVSESANPVRDSMYSQILSFSPESLFSLGNQHKFLMNWLILIIIFID